MKKILLLVALMFTVPAWAADTAGAPAANTAAATNPEQAVQPAKKAPIKAPKKKAKKALAKSNLTPCPQQCRTMHCPMPSGPVKTCCPVAPYTQSCP
jgi:hypothetical protein